MWWDHFDVNALKRPLLIGAICVMSVCQARGEAAFSFGRNATGRWWYGFAQNEETRQGAINLAMQRCSSSGPNCQLVRQFALGCFAFAVGSNGAGGFGTGFNTAGANSRATTECVQRQGQQCAIRASFCDTISEPALQTARTSAAERNRLVQLQAHGSSCNLSAKAISYSYSSCNPNLGCRPVKSFMEIVGDKILYQQNMSEGGKGFTFKLGETVDISGQAAQIPTSGAPSMLMETAQHVYGTAAFDGQTLILRIDEEKYSKSNQYFPDNVLLESHATVDTIDINACSACALREVRLRMQALVGAPKDMIITSNQRCELSPMR